MFIDTGNAVRIVSGYNKGGLGIVEKIRLEDRTGAALVFVNMVPQPENPARGLMVFEASQLRRHLATPREVEAMQLEGIAA